MNSENIAKIDNFHSIKIKNYVLESVTGAKNR